MKHDDASKNVRSIRARLASATRDGRPEDVLNSIRRQLSAAQLERAALEAVKSPLGMTPEDRRRISNIVLEQGVFT